MQRSKVFEWNDFIVVIVFVIAYGWIRNAYFNNTEMECESYRL